MKSMAILFICCLLMACAAKPTLEIVTTPKDLDAPKVLSITPAHSATQVTDLPRIEIVFSESMDSNSLNSNTISLKKAGISLGGTLLYDAPSRKVTLTPSGRLTLNTEHTLTVSTGVKDLAGNSLAADINSTFSTDTCPGPDAAQPKLGFNGGVNAIAKVGCVIYVGGDFTSVGVETGGGAALNTSTAGFHFGVTHQPINGPLSAVVSDGAGGWFIGGTFTRVGSAVRNNVAHIRSDGSLSNWNPDVNNSVLAIAISGDTIYLGGSFTTVGGIARSRVAAITANGGLLPWNPNANGQVLALAVSGSTVFVGGNFTEIGGATQSYLSALDDTTGNLAGGHLNPSASGQVTTLTISGSTLFAGGSFRCINTSNPPPTCTGGTNRNYLAAFSLGGNLLSWAPTLNGSAYAIAVSGDIAYVGGSFSCYGTTNAGPVCSGGTNRNNLVAVSVGANCLSSWSSICAPGGVNPLSTWNPDADNIIQALTVSNNVIYVGGNFTTISGTSRSYVAAVGSDGFLRAWNPNINHRLYGLAIDSNSVYIAGSFTAVNTQQRNRLAAISTDGVLQAWNPSVNSTVKTIAAGAGTIYAGGDFSQVNSVARTRLAALSTDGTLLNFNPAANSTIMSLIAVNNRLYAGGYFTTIAGQTRNRVAAFELSSHSLLPWNPNADGAVAAISVSGGTVYIGGYFNGLNDAATSCTAPGLVTRNSIAAVNETDGCATSWDPNANSNVNAIAVLGSEVYAGGSFTVIGGGARTYLARLNASTGLLLENPNSTGSIYTLLSAANALYVGGGFTTIGGVVRNYAAALNNEGSLSGWNPNADTHVYALAAAGNYLYVGGGFTRMGGALRTRFAIVSATNGEVIW